jgi:hypothetical protein
VKSIRGIAVHIGARVAAAAVPNEVLVLSAVRDLVAGLGLRFQDRSLRAVEMATVCCGERSASRLARNEHLEPADADILSGILGLLTRRRLDNHVGRHRLGTGLD